jgi:hypothetical protein
MQTGYIFDVPLGYAQSATVDASTLISSLSFAGGSPGIPPGTQLLMITPQTQAIRWRDDGTAPTAAIGYPLAVGAELRYTGANLASLRVISQVAGAIVNVVAYGRGPYS